MESISVCEAIAAAAFAPRGFGGSPLSLRADDIAIEGLVIEGASVGIDASDLFSAYRIHHNLIRHTTLFGIDFGSEGTRESRVDHNCLRDNESAAIGSELDDDSLWKPSDGPERDAWNARDLFNARIDHNATSSNGNRLFGALQIHGPGRRVRVTIDHNVSWADRGGILLQNSADSAIVGNDVIDTPINFPFGYHAMVIGGGNQRLVIATNRLLNPGDVGILFTAANPLGDVFPTPNRGVVLTQNQVRGARGIGIDGRIADSLISENTISHNGAQGVLLQSGSTGNVVRDNQTHNNRSAGIFLNSGPLGTSTGNVVHDNQANNNGISGITASLGTIGNRFAHNSMHGNGWRTDTMLPRADARDLNPLLNGMLQNVWIGNDCETDIPAGLICGVG